MVPFIHLIDFGEGYKVFKVDAAGMYDFLSKTNLDHFVVFEVLEEHVLLKSAFIFPETMSEFQKTIHSLWCKHF